MNAQAERPLARAMARLCALVLCFALLALVAPTNTPLAAAPCALNAWSALAAPPAFHAVADATPTATATTGACPDNYEPNDSFDEAPALLANTPYWAAICSAQDLDYYAINVSAGQHMRAELYNLPADYDLELFGPDPAYDFLGRSENAGTTAEAVEHDALTGGVHYIKIYGKNGAFHTSSLYFFKVTLSGATLTPEPTPSPTASPTPSATLTLTPAPPATPTSLPQATATHTPPPPTQTPTPTPTSPPAEQPDLTITDAWSEDGLVCYQLYNMGPGSAPTGHHTRLQVDNVDQALDALDVALKPGERLTRCFNYTWSCSAAQDTVRACADAQQALNESDESNNCREEFWKCDATAPRIVDGPHVSEVTSTSARICWETDEASDSVVRYGWRAGQYYVTASNGVLVTAHCVTLNGLSPASTYGLVAESTDAHGNTATSKPLLLNTLATPELVSPQVWLHVPEVLSGTVTLSADALDNTGVDRVVFTLDGVMVHTDSTPPYEWPCDTRELSDASHIFGARAFDLAGNGTVTTQAREVRNRFPVDLSPVRVFITDPPSRSGVFGEVYVETEVDHNLRSPIQELQVWADGQLLLDQDYHCYFVLGVRRCSGEPPLRETARWDASAYPVGSSYIISATASDYLGNANTASILVTIDRPPPSIRVQRSVTREGNRFAVQLAITNTGLVEIHDVAIQDQSTAFQSLAGVQMGTGTPLQTYDAGVSYSPEARGSTLQCTYPHTVLPGATLRIRYHTVPILFPPDETAVRPAIGDSLGVSYRSGSSDYAEHPSTRWSGSAGRRAALAEANYLLVTQPDALVRLYAGSEVHRLLATMAELASEKNGVLGYLSPAVANHELRSWIVPGGDWAGQLGAAFSSPSTLDAYVLFVGETEIVPSYNYDNVALSDHYYADVTGASHLLPELITGRIIGDSAAALALPLRASLDVHYGTGFDREHALTVSGYEVGSGDVFLQGALDIAADLTAQGVEVEQLHFSTFIEDAWTVHATDNDGFALGYMDDDAPAEVLIIRDEEQELYMYDADPRTLIRHFPVRFRAHDGFVTGDVDGDDRDEIITAEVEAGRINVYRSDGSLLASTAAPFGEWSGLALGDVLGDGWAGGVWIDDNNRDEILFTVRDSNRVHIWRMDGANQLRESPSITLDVSFSRYDGLAAGDVRLRRSGDDERWERDEIILLRGSANEIRLYDADGTRLALLTDTNGDGSNDVHFTRYDGLAVGDVDGLDDPQGIAEEEILVVSGDDDRFYIYHFEPHWEGSGDDARFVDWRSWRLYSRFFDDWFYRARLTGPDDGHDGVAIGRIDPLDNRKLAILRNRNGDSSSFQVLVSTWSDCEERANERVAWNSANISFLTVRGHGNSWGASPLGHPWDSLWGTFDRHPLFLSLSCLTGNYNDASAGDISFGEVAFQHGAAAFIGSTEVSWSSDNREVARRYFGQWDVDTVSAGKALKEFEREFAHDYWIREYNFYGEPKFGARGAGTAATAGAVTPANAAPPASLDITVPAYTVEHLQGLDYVDIPGGGVLLEDYQPRVPLYVQRVDLPAGYRVADVVLLERSGLATASGLLLPIMIPALDGLPAPQQPGQALVLSDGWYPARDFAWTVIEHEDGSSELAVTLYPFFYNALTLEARFYSQYRFQITYTLSGMSVTRLATDHGLYLPGQTVEIELDLENTGPAEDVVVEIWLRRYDTGEQVDGLLLRTLSELAGSASFAALWDSTGFSPGEYEVEAFLRSAAGEVLDNGRAHVRLGLSAAEVIQLSALPARFRPGDPVAVAVTVRNAGTVTLSGTAVVEIRDAGEKLWAQCYEPITRLAAGATQSFSCTWDSTGAAAGPYNVASYVLYAGSASPARNVTLEAEAEGRLFLPLVLCRRW